MYRLAGKNPLKEYKFMLDHNPSRLTLLDVSVGIGLINWEEYSKFRSLAIGRKL